MSFPRWSASLVALVTGVMLGVVPAASSPAASRPGEAVVVARTSAAQDSVAVVRLTWPGQRVSTPSVSKVRARLTRASHELEELSGGRFGLSRPRIVGPVRVAAPRPGRCYQDLDRYARAAERAIGPGRVDHLVISVPCALPGGSPTRAELDGRRIWTFGWPLAAPTGRSLLAAAVTRNLGLRSGAVARCRREGLPTTFVGNPACDVTSGGDMLDLQADSPAARGLGAPALAEAGWLGRRIVVRSTATVELASLSATTPDDPQARAIVVPDGPRTPVWVELRTPDGPDAAVCRTAPSSCGVLLRYGARGAQAPALVDALPGDFRGVALPVGSSVTTIGGTRITLLERTATSARLRIEIGVGPARPPAAPMGVSATDQGESARITWTPPDDRGASITRYRVVSSDGAERTFRPPTDGSAAFVVGRLTPGESYTFRMQARNEKGWSELSEPSESIVATRTGALADLDGLDALGGGITYGPTTIRPTVTLDRADPQPVTGIDLVVDDVVVATATGSGTAWTIEWDSSTVPDGTHQAWTRTTDAGGTVRESARVEVRTVTPAMSIVSPEGGALVGARPRISWTSTLPSDRSYTLAVTVRWNQDGVERVWQAPDRFVYGGEQRVRLDLDDVSAGGPVPSGPVTIRTELFDPDLDLRRLLTSAEVEVVRG